MKNSKVSIIVPVYNCEKYLKKLLESLKKQTYKNWEAIFVNDGSIDKSLEVIEKNNDERFIVINQKNKGVAAARNKGLKYASGEYITFVDSDDYVDSKYIECLVSNLEKYNVDLCVMGFKCFDDNYNFYSSYDLDLKEYELKTTDDYMNFLNVLNGSAICSKLYKKELLNNKSFYNLSIGEDALFNLEYVKNNNKIVTLNQSYYFYRNNPNSLTNSLRINLMDELESVLKKITYEDIYVFFCYRIYQEYILNIYCNSKDNLKKCIYALRNYEYVNKYLKSDIKKIVCNFSLAKRIYFQIINFAIKYNTYYLLYFIESLKLGLKYGKKKNK